MLQVEEMALQNLTLRRSDGVRIFYPITKLCKEPILNISRSANRWEGFKVGRRLPALQMQHQQTADLQTMCYPEQLRSCRRSRCMPAGLGGHLHARRDV